MARRKVDQKATIFCWFSSVKIYTIRPEKSLRGLYPEQFSINMACQSKMRANTTANQIGALELYFFNQNTHFLSHYFMKIILKFCFILASIFYAQLTFAANKITVCDVTFMLPAHLKVTKPIRSVRGDGVNECQFKIQTIKKTVFECRDKDEGGRPPYNVCDWTLGEPDPSVTVVRTNLRRDKKDVGSFEFKNDEWIIDEGKSAEEFDFFGKYALSATLTHGSYWFRFKHPNGESIFAGTSEDELVLLQLTPTIAVLLSPPVPDDRENGKGECTVFCASLQAEKK